MSKTTALIGALLVTVVMVGCGAKRLDRKEAANLLQQSPAMKEPLNWTLQEARVCIYGDSGFDNGKSRAQLQQAEVFRTAGLAQIKELGSGDWTSSAEYFRDMAQCPVYVARLVDIRLTAKGREESKKWLHFAGSYIVTVGLPAMVGVSGITRAQDGSEEVEYVWEYRPTPDGNALNFQPNRKKAAATFKLYDDGWRLVTSQ